MFSFGTGHPWNIGLPLQGELQDNYTAELIAILFAFICATCPIWVVSDCAGVVESGNRYLRGKAVSPKALHADLYLELQEAARDREVTLRWVPIPNISGWSLFVFFLMTCVCRKSCNDQFWFEFHSCSFKTIIINQASIRIDGVL